MIRSILCDFYGWLNSIFDWLTVEFCSLLFRHIWSKSLGGGDGCSLKVIGGEFVDTERISSEGQEGPKKDMYSVEEFQLKKFVFLTFRGLVM